MALQGVCEIELRDEQGNVVQRTKDKNMITNAIDKLINIDYIFLNLLLKNDMSIYKNIYTRMPILDKLIGGIVLFSTIQNEDMNNLYLGEFSDIVGGAEVGTEINNNDVRIGMFNNKESNVIYDSLGNSIGLKLTFDFATDRGNGTIKSVSLVPGICARSLYYNDAITINSGYSFNKLNPLSYIQNGTIGGSSINSRLIVDNDIYYLGYFKKNEFIIADASGGVLNFYIYRIKSDIGLTDTFNTNAFKDKELVKTIAEITCNNDNIYDRLYSYKDSIYYTYQSGKKLYIYKISPVDFSFTKEELTYEGNNFYNGIIKIYENYICGLTYYASKYHFTIIDINDLTLKKDIEIYSESANDIGYINNNLVFSTYYDYLIFDKNLEYMYNKKLSVPGSNDQMDYKLFGCTTPTYSNIEFPYIIYRSKKYYKGISSGYTPRGHQIMINSNFKFTIDNLATPVTKTASQTMKVIYTIKDAEQQPAQ